MSRSKWMNQVDTAGIILSYLSDDSIRVLHSLGLTPELGLLAENPLFWKARVETLLGKMLYTHPSVDWKRIYRALSLSQDLTQLRDISDNQQVIELLYSIGVAPTIEDLVFACTHDLPYSVRFILTEGSIHPDSSQVPSLIAAIDSPRCVRLLLRDGRADPNCQLEGTCMLERCCLREERCSVLDLLLSDKRTNVGLRNLYTIALDSGDNAGIVAILMAHRVSYHRYVLVIQTAVYLSRVKTLDLLIGTHRIDRYNPLDFFLNPRRERVRDREVLSALLQGLDQVPDDLYMNIISHARTEEEALPLIRLLLLDGRADPSYCDNAALRYASSSGFSKVVRLL